MHRQENEEGKPPLIRNYNWMLSIASIIVPCFYYPVNLANFKQNFNFSLLVFEIIHNWKGPRKYPTCRVVVVIVFTHCHYNCCLICATHVTCTQAVLQVVDKLPTISTQLKIIAAVKATRQGGDGKLFITL
jgi:hypothetical protein